MKTQEDTLKALTVLLKASGTVEKTIKKDILSYDLNPTEFSVMELLYNKGKQPIQLIGKKILIASSSITYVIDRLEEKGLVERVPDKKDRRITLVELNKSGREKMDNIFPSHSESIFELYEDFSEEEVQEFISLLKKVGFTAKDKLSQE